MVYVTGPSGVFPAPDGERNFYSYPDLAFMNVPENATSIKAWSILNTPENGSGYPMFIITITNAAADNCTSVLVNGVGQTAGAVAMTVGNATASAASIAAAITSFVPGAGPNYRAVNIGATIIGMSDTIGTGSNGDVVLPAFSGASTATYSDVGGGRDSGSSLVRFFIDASAGASETVMSGAAIEITEWLSYRGLQSGRVMVAASVVASAVSFERSANDMTVTLSNNATLTNVVSIGAINGDRITLQGNGADTQVVTASATIGLASSASYSLTGTSTKLVLEWDTTGSKWNEVSRASVADATQIRASGLPVPLQQGTLVINPLAGGVATFSPGQTGVSVWPGAVYENNITLVNGGALAANVNFIVDSTNALPGDTGVVFGNRQVITLGANAINFSDGTGVVASLPSQLALTGDWVATWTYMYYDVVLLAGIVSWNVAPVFSTTNTQFLQTAMYQNLSVTGAKIADATIDGATKLIDDSVDEVKLDALVRAKLNVQGRNLVKVSVPTIEMLALNTTRKLAVAAPGVGKAVVTTGVYAAITYIAPVYATFTNLQIISDTATAPQAESSLILVKTTNGIVIIPLTAVVGAGETQIIENEALYITTEGGDSTAGASNFAFYVEYMIVDL
jgi:hypothetical protein